jgi:hypothetical protein
MIWQVYASQYLFQNTYMDLEAAYLCAQESRYHPPLFQRQKCKHIHTENVDWNTVSAHSEVHHQTASVDAFQNVEPISISRCIMMLLAGNKIRSEFFSPVNDCTRAHLTGARRTPLWGWLGPKRQQVSNDVSIGCKMRLSFQLKTTRRLMILQ